MADSALLTTLSVDELREFMGDNLPPGIAGPTMQKAPDPAKRNICIAILSYDARIHARTAMCLMNAIPQLANEGWGITFVLREGDSMVARGRSYLASQFLQAPTSQACTDLVFVDTDLEWSGDEIVRLCKHNVDVVGGAYPFKDDSGNFPLRWAAHGLHEQNGLWEVQAVTPGFLRVTRRALEYMAQEMPWLKFQDRGFKDGQTGYMFFDNIHRPGGVFDEGYIFCERWRSVGGTVFLDPDLNFTHLGQKAYKHGSIRQWLDKKAETFAQLESEYPHIAPLILMKKAMGEKIDFTAEADTVDDQHSDAGATGVAASDSGANPAEYDAQVQSFVDFSRRGRQGDAGQPEAAADGRSTNGVGAPAGGQSWREVRPGANGSAGRHLPAGG